jgi:alpha-tubulin suppressor-like RCC1 family protein
LEIWMHRTALAFLFVFQSACAQPKGQDNPTTPVFPPVSPQWLNATEVSVGGDNSCAISSTAVALCWGAPTYGKLGVGQLAQWPLRPTRLAGNVPFVSISTGIAHACALTANSRAYCWGDNTFGKLGDTAFRSVTKWEPGPVATDTLFKSLTVGPGNTCGLTSRGVALCWGDGSYGQNGAKVNGVDTYSKPTVVASSILFSALATGKRHSCGISTMGDLYCWGSSRPDLAPNDIFFVLSRVNGAPRLVSITAGVHHTCGLTVDGIAYCWGWNDYGQLGDGISVPSDPRLRLENTQRTSPTPVSGNIRFGAISAGSYHTCGISLQGQAFCWGWNIGGQIGDGTTETRFMPTAVSTTITFRAIGAGSNHGCGIASDGIVYCWGWNDKGQLGDGTMTSKMTPQKVLSPSP